MKYIRNLFILMVAILGLSQMDVNAQGFSQRNLEQKIFKEIIRLPYYGVFDNIAFRVDGDTVTLMGKVVQPTTRKSAERVVERINGVTNVVNNIEVLPLSGFDDSIRLRTLRTLQNGGSLYRYFLGANPSVKIIVDGGNLTLEGFVANRGDKNLANVLANGVPGVFSVTNNLIVEKDRIR
ncbi:MAG: BON domain-containing protein [Pyrinomonadaceae bacterium]|nr:BON domain-containing protein [Pyrinomonadaceae bacterium]